MTLNQRRMFLFACLCLGQVLHYLLLHPAPWCWHMF